MNLELTAHHSLDLLLVFLHNQDEFLLFGHKRVLNCLHLVIELVLLERQALLRILVLRLVHCLVHSTLQLAKNA